MLKSAMNMDRKGSLGAAVGLNSAAIGISMDRSKKASSKSNIMDSVLE